MIGHWQKNYLDQYIVNLKEYYKNCEKDSFKLANKIQDLTDEEREYVNAHIDLKGITGFDREVIINSVFAKPDKINFAKHLLTSENIFLEVNELLDGKSTFVYLIDAALNNGGEFYFWLGQCLTILYKRGYKIKDCDEAFLKETYKNLPTQNALMCWTLARFAFKLNDCEKFALAFRNDRVLYTILSFKMKKPIGINYPNLLGIANNAIQHYRENGDIILKAMQKYEVYSDILYRDKKNVFQEKKADYDRFKPIQDKRFQEIVTILFPELA